MLPAHDRYQLRKDRGDSPKTDPAPVQQPLFTTLERQRAEATSPVPATEVGQVTYPTLSDPLPAALVDQKPKAVDYRIIGVLGKLYVLLEGKEGLVLMDQHAAHERVLFEEMKRRMETEGVPSQRLLTPIMVDLPPRDFDLISRNLETLNKLGLSAEPFGGNTLKIDALPVFLKSDDPESFLNDVINEIRSSSDRMSALRLVEDMIATTVCRHAVKANDPLH